VNKFDDDSVLVLVVCLLLFVCCCLFGVVVVSLMFLLFNSAHYSTTRHRVKSQVDIGAAKVWSNNDTSNRLKKKKDTSTTF